MTDSQFRSLIENSDVFKSFPKFKQNIFVAPKVIQRLKDYFHQAEINGIDYLKQNPNLTISDVNLIKSVL